MEIVLISGKVSGHMSLTQFGLAAYTLFDVCVVHYGYGGVAGNVGKCTESSEQRQQRQDVVSSPEIFSTAKVLRQNP